MLEYQAKIAGLAGCLLGLYIPYCPYGLCGRRGIPLFLGKKKERKKKMAANTILALAGVLAHEMDTIFFKKGLSKTITDQVSSSGSQKWENRSQGG